MTAKELAMYLQQVSLNRLCLLRVAASMQVFVYSLTHRMHLTVCRIDSNCALTRMHGMSSSTCSHKHDALCTEQHTSAWCHT